ncbi:MAG: lytic transglycosylase domain-containing protein [Streptosporangiaceae bacterium]|jgi:hypothetical protein
MADGRTALSQHRRRSNGKRRSRRLVRAFLITTVAAATAITTGTVYTLTHLNHATFDPVAEAAAEIPVSHSATLLEHERQQMILDTASRTLSLVSTPKLAKPVSEAPAAVPVGGGGSSTTPTSTTPVVSLPAPNPGTAQSIAYNMLPSFGFSASTQYSCLNNIWTRESGWVYDAENASGAYGIPQALPGDKMASAGPDWQTDPTTQIKWGIGYIKSVYGSPCQAWAFWQAHGWY